MTAVHEQITACRRTGNKVNLRRGGVRETESPSVTSGSRQDLVSSILRRGLSSHQESSFMERTRFYRKVLVVDDEPEVLRSVHDLLRIDYEVVTCQRAAEALDHLKAATDVAVILSDQRMPGMSGVELLQQAQSIRPETTRLLFTAYADIHAVIDAINQGHVFRYITKPWEAEELESVIRQAVERHDMIIEKNQLLAELQTANAKLTEANRLKGVFLEVASHELNTPVTVVLGLTDLWKLSLAR